MRMQPATAPYKQQKVYLFLQHPVTISLAAQRAASETHPSLPTDV